jgi:hypothetical protein
MAVGDRVGPYNTQMMQHRHFLSRQTMSYKRISGKRLKLGKVGGYERAAGKRSEYKDAAHGRVGPTLNY